MTSTKQVYISREDTNCWENILFTPTNSMFLSVPCLKWTLESLFVNIWAQAWSIIPLVANSFIWLLTFAHSFNPLSTDYCYKLWYKITFTQFYFQQENSVWKIFHVLSLLPPETTFDLLSLFHSSIIIKTCRKFQTWTFLSKVEICETPISFNRLFEP